ncbi:MAG TPA: RNA 3'-phosphate cyclase [Anaerolineaceae bacterium]|nr:MAG: RNA-3'-phosphate cyclase [Anaerolineaceae bacterium 46_22]HAF48856.1 RNA 3'-phosphate cyclase [Anaerolineaceae bacterium]
MIEIDGAYGEGGGQVLRSSLTLSALTGKPVTIRNIRANRSKPGLRPQHLAAVNAIAKITQAQVEGNELNSNEVFLTPNKVVAGDYKFDIPTAGALSLVLQTVFLPLSFAKSKSYITLTGGTHVPWSPIWDYIQACWLPVMTSLGFRGDTQLEIAGFYPRGGGRAQVDILPPKSLKPLVCLERGDLLRIEGWSGVATLDLSIAKRQKHQALRRLYEVCRNTKIKTVQVPSIGKGTFILLKAVFSSGSCACYSALGAPGKRAEMVADEVVDQLLSFLGTDGCIDHYMADQILLPLSVIPGKSAFSTSILSQHVLTNVQIIQKFLPVRINVTGRIKTPGTVEVEGVRL